MIRIAAVLLALFTAVAASAQRPLFDPDDFLDPSATGGRPTLISRIVLGGASNMSGDGFRPLGESIGYVHLATSFSWRSVQFDYKRSQMKAEDGEAAEWRVISEVNPDFARGITTFSDGATREGVSVRQTRKATPKSKDTLHAAWYWPVGGAGGGIPVMLRTRVTFATQPIETDFVLSNSSSVDATPPVRVSGRERTFALDTDTWFRIAGHDVFGSLAFSETTTRTDNIETDGIETTDEMLGNRKERALTYTNRFPSLSLDRARILIRPTLTIGGISNRGGSAVNLVNPAIEIFRPFARTGANLHIIWSPQWSESGKNWTVTHQVAVLIDRALFVKVF